MARPVSSLVVFWVAAATLLFATCGGRGGGVDSSSDAPSETRGTNHLDGGSATGAGGALASGGASEDGATATASGGAAAGTAGASGGSGGAIPNGGRAGNGDGGRTGVAGAPSMAGGAPGAGGTVPSGGTSGTTNGNCSANCTTHRWACWPMPNPVGLGLPNPVHYTELGDGTVRDDVTCLTWEKAISAQSYTVSGARAYCAGKGAGWRLATRIELMSILDYTRSGAKADASAFPATPAAFFKTASEWVLTTKQIGAGAGKDFQWAFNFSDGIVTNARSATAGDRARCVRGGGNGELDAAPGALAVAPAGQYTVIAAGEVRDNYTGLVWMQATSPMQMTFTIAKTYCASLALNGHAWRLPSIREISTLVDEAQVAPAINRAMFPGTKFGAKSNNWYWASHNAAGSTTAAWAINFDDGFTGANTATDTTAWNYFTSVWVKCVR